jgi:drug/metabolite transporter (DMT)-like permease
MAHRLLELADGHVIAATLIPFSPRSDYSAQAIVALGAVGIVGLLAQLAMTRAFSTGPATLLASLQYSTVAFAALYGVISGAIRCRRERLRDCRSSC